MRFLDAMPHGEIDYYIFFIAIVIGYIWLLRYIVIKSSVRRKTRKDKFFTSITEGFKNNILDSLLDFENIFKGIHGISKDTPCQAEMTRLFRSYLVDLTRRIIEPDLAPEQRKLWKQKITGYIGQIERDSPYADLPDAERNIVVDIEKFINMGEKNPAQKKLEDLASLIKVRQEQLEKSNTANKWAIVLAVFGLILTIIFGIK